MAGRKSNMKFLDEKSVKKEIKNLVKSARTLKVAVAYWGKRATQELELENPPINTSVTVVCDLMSGACNPEEISNLRKSIGHSNVKKLDGLHAKVWLTENGAIIGSSNASANGLGFEGNETKSLIEANLFVEDQTALNSIEIWFDNLKHTDISQADLRKAKKLWKKNRLNRPKPESKTPYNSIMENPGEFFDRNILVWAFEHEEPPKQTTRYAQTILKHRGYKKDTVEWYDVDADTVKSGSYIIDFNYDPKKKYFSYEGTYKVLEDEPFQTNGKCNILLCRPTKFCHIPRSEFGAWRGALSRAANATHWDDDEWEWTIEDFHKYIIAE